MQHMLPEALAIRAGDEGDEGDEDGDEQTPADTREGQPTTP